VDVCDEYQKEQKLARLLEEIGCQPQNKIIIFVETKRKADDLTRYFEKNAAFDIRDNESFFSEIRLMRREGYPAMCIHGDSKKSVTGSWVNLERAAQPSSWQQMLQHVV